MHAFHIHYRNTQGTLMRILTAVSRRGLEVQYLHAVPAGHGHSAELLLDVNAKQIGQLCRDWHAIVDVTDVRAGAPEDITQAAGDWTATPHPPSSATVSDRVTRAAMA